MRLRNIIILVIIAVFPNVANTIKVEGESVHYYNKTQKISASGNVVIQYKGYHITAPEVYYDNGTKIIQFPQNLEVMGTDYHITANNVEFNLNSVVGTSKYLQSRIGKLHIKSTKTSIKDGRIDLKNATLTTCDLNKEPHYHLESRRLFLFPQFGFLVAYDNWLKSSFLPFDIWVPTFVYGNQKYSLVKSPLPHFGSNEREGFFVKHGFGYFIDETSHGSIDIGNTEKQGLWLGFTHNQMLDQQNMLRVSSHLLGDEAVEGGITWFHELRNVDPQESTENNSLNGLFDRGILSSNGRIISTVHFRELIIDSWVDKIPKLTLEIDPFYLDEDKQLDVRYMASIGRIREYTINDETRLHNQAQLYWTLRKKWDFPFFDPKSQLTHFGYWYSDVEPWQRVVGDLSINIDLSILKPKITYRKVVIKDGSSPFDFQRIYAIEEDEIEINASKRLWNWEAGIVAAYETKGWDPRIANISLTYHFHCWGITFNYETVREQFGFGFQLF